MAVNAITCVIKHTLFIHTVLRVSLKSSSVQFNMSTKTNASVFDINQFNLQSVKNFWNPVILCKDNNAVATASKLLNSGALIALPTDTVYGLACSANDRLSIQKLYAIKGRIETKPVAICVGDIENVRKWGEAKHISDDILKLLLPGPVTIILNKTSLLCNPFLNPSVSKIGIRIPDNKFIRDVARLSTFPIALTSANVSSEPSTLRVEEFRSLWPKLSAVFDQGDLGNEESRAASTVVDLSCVGYYTIVREGVACSQTITVLERHGFRRQYMEK